MLSHAEHMQAQQMHVEHADSVGVDVLREVTAAAAEILTTPPRRAAALTYLRQRGIDPDPLRDFPLGYAPPGWTRLVGELRGRFPDAALLEAGIVRRSSRGNLIDSFRDRVIFPIRTIDGHVSGFLGRDLSGNPDTPKYLNSRHSALFVKGNLLYGLHEGLAALQNTRRPVVLEGPLDVLALASRARKDERGLLPIAACGTAFTTAHARTLARVAGREPVIVGLDGDTAGRAAALRAGRELRAAGAEVRVAVLPNGLDPADYLAHPGSTLETFTDGHAVPLLAVEVQQAIAVQGDRMQWIEGRLAAARTIAKDLATYPINHAAAQIGWIANILDLDAATFTFELVAAYRSSRNADAVERDPARRSVLGPTPPLRAGIPSHAIHEPLERRC